jgi:hypothetical protein
MALHTTASDQPGRTFRVGFLTCVGIANAVALIAAIKDGGIGSIGMVFVWGPMMNLAFALIGCLAWFAFRRATPSVSASRHFSAVIVWPVVAAVIVFIANMVVGNLLSG